MTRPRIYLDNAATSWPKPPSVYNAIDDYQRRLGAPAGRGTIREAIEVERLVAEARSAVARLLGAEHPRQVVFTASCTDSLNTAIHGLLQPGDHAVTTVVEHNSVLRPLRELERTAGIEVSRVDCDDNGLVDPDDVRRALRPDTKLVAVIHASNVTGAVQPIAEIGKLLVDHPALLLVDAAQSAGHLPIDVRQLGCDLLAAPGHKGLLGPLGTGILYIRPGVEDQLRSFRQGGTGTRSEEDIQPHSLPDKYEAGNLNVPGIVGLGAGVKHLLGVGVEQVQRLEEELAARLMGGLSAIDGVALYGPASNQSRVAVVSVNVEGYDPQEVAAMLDAAHGVQVRAGIHCAPRIHGRLGTLARGGAVRLSPGCYSTTDDIDATVTAFAELAGASLA